ncbi:N-acetyl sugar amidotransferase [Candidatus Merdisoma sp. JLR.KK011]|uniref:N-acetyl sugar amidotransferase n=1 Tax=Candidatus Merdisoma sp. JLR.KK011 TaxID=3114299 RepID=UPI002FF38F1E
MYKYQRCTRCVMDNKSDRTITFDNKGYCNYCSDVIKRMPTSYFPNEEGKKLLDATIKQIKSECREDKFDCLVGVSGGIDSSYILYLGYQYNLRMLAVHIDDGLDNPVAVENIKKLINKTNTHLITLKPDHEEYADLLKALFKASVPNLAIVQDNLIVKAIDQYGKDNNIKYSLDGNNIAHESILEHGDGNVNFCDKKHILAIHKKFGEMPIKKTEFITLSDRYLKRSFLSSLKHIRPLNYISYNLEESIKKLNEFCGFEYYGGKHYESILTRFLQCYYLPEKYGADKRKSHYSSLIVSGQMTRDEALRKLEEPLYLSQDLLDSDKKFLADYMGVSLEQLDAWINLPPKKQSDYPHSLLNEMSPIARKFRKIIE